MWQFNLSLMNNLMTCLRPGPHIAVSKDITEFGVKNFTVHTTMNVPVAHMTGL